MKLLWNWRGEFFGHRDGDNLWSLTGEHVGRFHYNEVYGPDGQYLGEIKVDDRLITCLNKKSFRKEGFTPDADRAGAAPQLGRVGYSMYAGFEDFPVLH